MKKIIPFIFNTRDLAYWLEDLGLFADSFQSYLDDSTNIRTDLFSWSRLSMNLFYIVIISIDNSKIKSMYLNMIIMFVVVYNLFPFSSVIGRVALYFGVFQMLYLPIVETQNRINRLAVIIYPIAIFVMYLSTGLCGILPYTFNVNY